MIALFVGILTGMGVGLLTWYGWAAAENLRELSVRRASARASEAAPEADESPRRR